MIRHLVLALALSTVVPPLAAADTPKERVASYKKVGITGDRLDLLIDHVNATMYGVGGGELATPKQLKVAKVMFEVVGSGGSWTVRRYVFDGDRLSASSAKSYLEKPGAKAFR